MYRYLNDDEKIVVPLICGLFINTFIFYIAFE
jgi:hypothetical protein